MYVCVYQHVFTDTIVVRTVSAIYLYLLGICVVIRHTETEGMYLETLFIN